VSLHQFMIIYMLLTKSESVDVNHCLISMFFFIYLEILPSGLLGHPSLQLWDFQKKAQPLLRRNRGRRMGISVF